MEAVRLFFRVLLWIAAGILVLGIVRNSKGAARVIDSLDNVLHTGFHQENIAAGRR